MTPMSIFRQNGLLAGRPLGLICKLWKILLSKLPKQCLTGTSNTFQHPDVHEHFPDVLRAFKNPEIQNVLNSVVINHFVRDPEYIRAFYPDVDESLIMLLATDNGFRTLFKDEDFHGVLQEPC